MEPTGTGVIGNMENCKFIHVRNHRFHALLRYAILERCPAVRQERFVQFCSFPGHPFPSANDHFLWFAIEFQSTRF